MKKRQLYVLCDIEGASGISPANRQAMRHGSEAWQAEGRGLITSDVSAVCDAANAFGIDEIVLNDSHDNGKREPNVLMDELPRNVRLVRRPHLPGKARHMVSGEPYGDHHRRPARRVRRRRLRSAYDPVAADRQSDVERPPRR